VLLVMERYKISPAQIYSITCDNARNMVKMVDLFNENSENNDEPVDDTDEENISNLEDNDDVILQNIQDMIGTSDIEVGPLTTCMRCAVHTFQLAICDSMKDRSIQGILSKARKAVKILRTQTYAAWLKREGLKQAILDIETRWNSTFNMLYRLIELKQFCVTNEQIILSSNDWNLVGKIVTALEPAKIATVQMQSNSLTPGDIYGIWLKTQMSLSKINIPLSKTLLKNMAERQKHIFMNPVFESAIYLDPHYQHLMSVTSKTNAVLHLVNTYNLMKNIKNYNDTVQDQDTDEFITEISETTNENIETGLEENDPNNFQLYLQSLSQGIPSSSQSSSSNTDTVSISIVSLLNLYDNQPILPHTESILFYWESKKFECPELYALSHVVMAVPTTQVSVERSFSSLKFVFGDLRSRLGSELLEKIMLIRANK
ncbi:zinc finger BED domain-containing protein 4-like, partial [Myzus persicae]|uniref:zinc finger BED domain-containing protein 4-like n=1 Tax=Myzus persicae TaxID=13164 RepID=UPI000B932011